MRDSKWQNIFQLGIFSLFAKTETEPLNYNGVNYLYSRINQSDWVPHTQLFIHMCAKEIPNPLYVCKYWLRLIPQMYSTQDSSFLESYRTEKIDSKYYESGSSSKPISSYIVYVFQPAKTAGKNTLHQLTDACSSNCLALCLYTCESEICD